MNADAGLPAVRIERWSEGDLGLERRMNTPEMKAHLGGPETDAQIVARHRRYVALAGTGTGRMFRIVAPSGVAAGSIGYWERQWNGQTVYELGWSVLPEFQRQGIAAAAAVAALACARAERSHQYAHAFPPIGHPASNAVCRRAGFTLIGECDFEYPPGRAIRSNDWRADLTAPASPPAAAARRTRPPRPA